MKDKDTDLIYEAYAGGREAYDTDRPSKAAVADLVKAKFGMDIQWDEGTRKWWRLNDLTGEYVIATGDEKMDIWSIEDNDSYMQHKAEGEGMQRHLRQSGL